MDGFTATKEIREHEKNLGLTKTPIIALTTSVIDIDIFKDAFWFRNGWLRLRSPLRKRKAVPSNWKRDLLGDTNGLDENNKNANAGTC